jgi:hypothetical protein
LTALVVRGDGDVHIVQWGVGIAEGDGGDVHVGALNQGLVVSSWITNDNKTGFQESIY